MDKQTKNDLKHELYAMIGQWEKAHRHSVEIMSKIMKIVIREDCFKLTSDKRKVIEELKLNWKFVGTLHEDLAAIARELERSDFPALPEINISDDLWETESGGLANELFRVDKVICDHLSKITDLVWVYSDEIDKKEE